MKTINSLPSFNGVAAGSTATLNLPIIGVYHALRLYFTLGGVAATIAEMAALITGIRVKINGKVQRTYSAAELMALNAFRGIAPVNGHLPIFFAEPWRRTAQGEDVLAWGMVGVSTFQVEVDIAAGATSPALLAVAEKSSENRSLGAIVKVRKFAFSAAGAGAFNIQTLPKTDNYFAMHMGTAAISDVEIKVNQVEQVAASRSMVHQMVTEKGWVPQTGYTHLAFDHTGRVGDILMVKDSKGTQAADFRVDLTMTGAANFTLITEVVGGAD